MALSLTVTGRRHRQGTAAVLAQVMDATSPGQLAVIPGSLTVNPTTFSSTLLFAQAQAGQLLLSSAGPTYSQPFTASAGIPYTIANAVHGLGTQDLFVQLYDTAGQALDPAGIVTVHPSTFLVTLTFLQAQSGTVVLSAPTSSFAADFTNQSPTLTVASGTHGLGTANLLWQVWDDATPRLLIHPGSVTLNSSTLGVTFAFTQAQSGRYVLAAPATMAVVPFAITTGALMYAAGGMAAPAVPVSSSLRAAPGVTNGVATRVASSLRAGAGTTAGVGNRIASSLRTASGAQQATRVAATSSLRVSAGIAQGASSRIQSAIRLAAGQATATRTAATSSLRASLGAVNGLATRIASSLRPGAGMMHGPAVATSTAVRGAPGTMQATRTAATSSLLGAMGHEAGVGQRIASSLRTGLGMFQGTRVLFASSLRASVGTHHGQAVPVNHLARSSPGQQSGAAVRLASSLRAATGQLTAAGGANPSANLPAVGRMMGHPVLITTAPGQLPITIRVPGTTHQAGSAALTADICDAVTLLQWGIPGSVTIHPTLFDVTVTILDGRSTLVQIMPLPAPYILPFTNQKTLSIPGATHGLGSADLLWQCVETGTPGQVIRPGSLTCDPGSFQVEVTFAQFQSGTLTLSRGFPVFVQAFTPPSPVVISAGTHGLGTQGVRTTVWDTGTPRALVLPGSLTLAANGTVTLGFLQPQSGRVVLSASPPIFQTVFSAPSAQLRASPGRMQGAALLATTQLLPRAGAVHADVQVIASAGLPGAARITGRAHVVAREPAFGPMTLVVPGPTHGMNAAALLYECYDTTSGLQTVGADLVTISATTGELRCTWGQPLLGAVILYEAPTPYLASFTNTTQLIVDGATHGLGTSALLWQVRDTQSPAQVILPDRVLVNTSSAQVTFQFGQGQSGSLVLTAGTPTASHTFAAQTVVGFPGSSHALGTPYLLWRVHDAAGLTVEDLLFVDAQAVSATPPYDATLTLGQAESGTLILSAPPTRFLVLLAPPGSASYQGAGTMRGQETLSTSSLRTGAGQFTGVAGPIAHAILSRTSGIQGLALRIASSLQVSTGTQSAVRVGQTSSLRVGAGQMQAVAIRLSSSLKGALGAMQATRLAATSSLRAGAGHMQATGLPLPPGEALGQGRDQALAVRVASSLRTGGGQAQAGSARGSSSLRPSLGRITGLAVSVPHSLRLGAGQVHGSAVVVASGVRAAPGQLRAVAGVLVPGVIGAHGDTHSQMTRLASSLRTGAGQFHGATTRQTTSLVSRPGTAHGAATPTVPTSLTARAALLHGVALLLSNTLRAVVGTHHGAASLLNASAQSGAGALSSSRVSTVPSALVSTAQGQLHEASVQATSSLRGGSGQHQASSARMLASLRLSLGALSASAVRASSSLVLATGQMHSNTNRASTLALTAQMTATPFVRSGAFATPTGALAAVPFFVVGTPAIGQGALRSTVVTSIAQQCFVSGQVHTMVSLVIRPRELTGALGSGAGGVFQMNRGIAVRFR